MIHPVTINIDTLFGQWNLPQHGCADLLKECKNNEQNNT